MNDPAQPDPRWKHDGVRVVPGDRLDPNTAQTPGMDRQPAITFARVGAQKLWAGTVHIHPDAKTGAHRHGALESVIYVEPRADGVHRRGRAGATGARGQRKYCANMSCRAGAATGSVCRM